MVLLLALSLGACARHESARSTAVTRSTEAGSPATSDTGVTPGGSAKAAPVVKPTDAAGLIAAVREGDAPVTLVNVWATWCGPCREEFPDIVRLERDYRDRGLRVLFVSADFDDQLAETKQFLARHGVDAPSYIKTGDDMQFIDAMDKRWSGALPATFIYDRAGKLRTFREGKASYAFFEHEVLRLLSKPQTSKEGPS
jgi:thiol-disulfide isomerase/thioredoxin